MLSKLPSTISLLGSLLPFFLPPALSHSIPAHPSSHNNPLYTPLSFTLTATASHITLASPPDPSDSTAISEVINQSWDGTLVTNGFQTVGGTFTLKAVHCQPKSHKVKDAKESDKKGKKDDVLQILLHGAIYNKTMWSGFGFGYPYDWQSFATSQGYHTLALDRLSHGENDPRGIDPLKDVQMPLQTELLHQLISLTKTNHSPKPNSKSASPKPKTNPLGRKFKQIALVGHSLGSYLSVALARSYPLDASALVLTGYSLKLNTLHVASAPWVPAPSVFPARFPADNYLHNLEYLAIATLEGREKGFYDNATDASGKPYAYDPEVAKTDYVYSDANTLGEVVSLYDWGVGAEEFEGSVLVATGQRDWVCCSPPEEECVKRLEETGRAFPRAKKYEVWAPEGTGHGLTLSYSAGKTLEVVHEFLGREI
ncbi:Alpha/Beta hydrolase protein [Copromyces sp. CBS 386.78]|nr:Alpha/Beta hydrolase protein [Copromyces sp. CBS 386.78]